MGCFSRKILLTVNDYEITLSRNIKFYQNDTIELCFTILEYETEFTEDNRCVHELVQLIPLKAYILIESPEGEDYVEATSIRSNEVIFRLSKNHTNFVGIGRMQIILKDTNGCRITLPHFEFEIKESINPYWDDEDEPSMPDEPSTPEEPIEELYMYYGRISIEEIGNRVIQYDEITEEMIKTARDVVKVPASTLGKTSLGLASETHDMDYQIVAVPKSKRYVVTKDNGIGGKVKFYSVDAGSSDGVNITIDGIPYLLYGELLYTQGETFIYID